MIINLTNLILLMFKSSPNFEPSMLNILQCNISTLVKSSPWDKCLEVKFLSQKKKNIFKAFNRYSLSGKFVQIHIYRLKLESSPSHLMALNTCSPSVLFCSLPSFLIKGKFLSINPFLVY